MTTNEKTKIINVLSNIFLKDYGYCSTVLKQELVDTKKLPLNVLSKIMSQPTVLNDLDFSIVIWLYQALSNSQKYKYTLPVIQTIFSTEEIEQSLMYEYVEPPKKEDTEVISTTKFKTGQGRPKKQTSFKFQNKYLFLEEVTKDLSEKDATRLYNLYTTVFNKIEESELFLEKEVNKFTIDELIDLFEKNGWTTLNAFRARKNHLKTYITWLNKKQSIILKKGDKLPISTISIDNISGITKIKQLFIKDFDDLVDMLDTVFDTEQYIMFKLMAYLSWFGFTHNEIFNLLKTDVDFSNSTISSWKSGHIVSHLPEEVMQLCKQCIAATEYTQEVDGKSLYFTYKNNNYLIRTFNPTSQTVSDKQNNKPVTYTYVAKMYYLWSKFSKHLNIMNPHYGRDISLPRIYKSGMYYKIYEYEQTENIEITQALINEICRVSEDTGKDIFLADYLQWKNAFYE